MVISRFSRIPLMVVLPLRIGLILALACLGGCGGGGKITDGTGSSQTPNNPVYGLDFGPYVVAGQDPNTGSAISSTQIASLLTGLKGYTKWIRTFGTQNGLENVAPLARQMGFKTAIGAYIGSDTNVNNGQIANLIAAVRAGNVDIAIVGNEVLLNNPQMESQMIAYLQSVKSQVPAGVQVTYADTWNTIVAHPNVIAAEDVVSINIYPLYENAPIGQALSTIQTDYAKAVQVANGRSVIVSETGWPSSGNPPSSGPAAAPSSANAAAYFGSVEAWARTSNVPLFYFEAYDEPWKANHGDYSSWGIWDMSGNLKEGMNPVFYK